MWGTTLTITGSWCATTCATHGDLVPNTAEEPEFEHYADYETSNDLEEASGLAPSPPRGRARSPGPTPNSDQQPPQHHYTVNDVVPSTAEDHFNPDSAAAEPPSVDHTTIEPLCSDRVGGDHLDEDLFEIILEREITCPACLGRHRAHDRGPHCRLELFPAVRLLGRVGNPLRQNSARPRAWA